MARERKTGTGSETAGASEDEAALAPGKRTRTMGLRRRGGGEPLPDGQRMQLERAFGQGLADVRVHDDPQAADRTRAVGAMAYARGQDISFAPGQYRPGTPDGDHLLAHEVAHTVQQRGGRAGRGEEREGGEDEGEELPTTQPGDAAERQADSAAAAAVAGNSAQVSAQPAAVARKTPGERKKVQGQAMFKTPAAAVSADGTYKNTQTVKPAEDTVKVVAPGVHLDGRVELKDDVDPDPETITVGWLQTIISSNRTGIYKKDGKIVHKDITTRASTRDVNPKNPGPAPFYWKPEVINKDTRSVSVNAEDQPSALFPMKIAGATLVEVQGEDSFNASFAAGQAAAPEVLQSFNWQAPFNVTLDATGNGTGGELGIQNAKGAVDPKNKGGGNAEGNDTSNHLVTCESDEAAAALLAQVGWVRFVKELPKHEGPAPESYWHMVSALWKSSAKLSVRVTGKDQPKLKIELKGDRTVSLGESDTAERSALMHMISDPTSFKPGHSIQIQVGGTTMATIDFPFLSKTVDNLTKSSVFGDDKYGLELGVNDK